MGEPEDRAVGRQRPRRHHRHGFGQDGVLSSAHTRGARAGVSRVAPQPRAARRQEVVAGRPRGLAQPVGAYGQKRGGASRRSRADNVSAERPRRRPAPPTAPNARFGQRARVDGRQPSGQSRDFRAVHGRDADYGRSRREKPTRRPSRPHAPDRGRERRGPRGRQPAAGYALLLPEHRRRRNVVALGHAGYAARHSHNQLPHAEHHADAAH